MTIPVLDIAEVCGNLISKSSNESEGTITAKNTYVLPNFILATYDELLSCCTPATSKYNRRVLIPPHKLSDGKFHTVSLRLHFAAGYCARNEMQLR